jgi:two-component system response regulator AtoC
MQASDLKLLIIDDEPNIRTGLAQGLRSVADSVTTAADAREGLAIVSRDRPDIVITDLRLPGELSGIDVVRRVRDEAPDTLVIVITAYATVETAVEAMRLGAFDFVTKPVDLDVIRHQVRKAAEHHQLVSENRHLREELNAAGGLPEIVGNCAATRDVIRQIRQLARTDATILILGESGTGKELTARAIHQLSERRARPFVGVNLGALPENLLESELFGHEKGAFTDAQKRRTGHFEQAEGGTLFLDEITETPPKTQISLLRVLEEREFRRVGGEQVISTDARVISATNQDIDRLVRDGKFREDLFYRLNVVPITLPALRERRDDIPLLAEHFLDQFCRRHRREPKRLAPKAMRMLTSRSWPGNIRQFRNFIERLVVTLSEDVIRAEDLPEESRPIPEAPTVTLADAVEEAEKQAIMAALSESEFHRERASELLDVSIRTLHYKMSRYGLH